MTGVPLPDLHCPTCGAKYEDYTLYSDSAQEQFVVPQIVPPIVERPLPWYILCPNNHMWSVKTLWRQHDPLGPDAVLLDRYLGTS